jgi:hypothetical protein
MQSNFEPIYWYCRCIPDGKSWYAGAGGEFDLLMQFHARME